MKNIAVFFAISIAGMSFDADAAVKIVTSVAPITNIVHNVAGASNEVHGIVPEGMNSHTFEPVPSDIKWLREADIIILNGLDLETPTLHLAKKVKKNNAPVVLLADATLARGEWRYDFSFPKEKGHPNPHLWPNIAHAIHFAEVTRDALVALDAAHAAQYRTNTDAYIAKLRVLDSAIYACVKGIPEVNRKLVTYHDSYAYFAPRYGMRVIAAVQPADFSEPTPREVARIITQLRREKVPAIFGSEVFPSKVLEQISREAGARYVDQLADDDLPGEKTDPKHT
ncbi:MAG: metal ABC transporter substrate-binding protein, partial [Gammaproteobacteria bacterium]|nr:metal ABC transporter substrate-binding protein [Gammaproteobacteria bacterium]